MLQKLIKTDTDYTHALTHISEIMGAEPGTSDFEELELLGTLIDIYEDEHFPIDLPDPISAIKFRMEQLNLTDQNLVPFIGSRSKVSEVLNKKRPLSLSMMRALHKGLGIPSDILLKEQGSSFPDNLPGIEWEKFPIKEMIRKGLLPSVQNMKDASEELMRDLIRQAGGIDSVSHCFFKRSPSSRENSKNDPYATIAWCLKVLAIANTASLSARYQKGVINERFLEDVARLNYFENGPLLAKEFVEKHGIHLIIVPHLSKTYLDGAVMPLADGTPVIGLTLRYDRIDNFWFCLLHELAHIGKHFSSDCREIIIDDLDLRGTIEKEDPRELEADNIAEDALIPNEAWNTFSKKVRFSKVQICDFANQLGTHPAIVAGRIRYERKNYRIFSRMVGYKGIRKHFSEFNRVI
jgi:HTH-type transcriptional regulator/antitoxin HigA